MTDETKQVKATTQAQPGEGTDETPVLTWEGWLGSQDEQVQALVARQTEGLLNTVKATRSERDDLAKQIKQLAKGQADGSEAKAALEEMASKLEKTERRAAFLEEAMRPEVQCKNARAAWLLAESGNLFDRKGAPDWEAIKREAPELFGVNAGNANAGNGTKEPPAPASNMNDFIRKSSGRK